MEPSGVGHSELTKDLSVNSFVHAEIFFMTLGHFINQAKLHPLPPPRGCNLAWFIKWPNVIKNILASTNE